MCTTQHFDLLRIVFSFRLFLVGLQHTALAIHEVSRVLVVSELIHVLGAGHHVLTDRREVHIGNALGEAVLTHDRRDGGVMGVRNAREQVVLDLVVQAAVDEGQPGAAHVGRGEDLLAQEGLVDVLIVVVLEQMHAFEVVGNHKEERQVVTTHQEQRANVQEGVDGGHLVQREENPAEHKETPGHTLKHSVAAQQLGEVGLVKTLNGVLQCLDDVVEAKEAQQREQIDVLVQVLVSTRAQRVNAQEGVAHDIGIVVDIVRCDVVLHDVLVDPVHCTATNPVLRHAQDAVDPPEARNGTVVGVVLDVQADQGEHKAQGSSQVPLVVGVLVHVVLREESHTQDSSHLKKVARRSEGFAAGKYLLHKLAQFQVVSVSGSRLQSRCLANKRVSHPVMRESLAMIG
mmetsp:Transcript_41046/g.71033  ORF Transcript_41046/g.71033 Transcript_41046/m.71033 type:complete len:401 (-) Transcript_41046:222-1424(-)